MDVRFAAGATAAIRLGAVLILSLLGGGAARGQSAPQSAAKGTAPVDSPQLQALRRDLMGIEPLTGQAALDADVNRDGILDIADVIQIIEWLINPTPSPTTTATSTISPSPSATPSLSPTPSVSPTPSESPTPSATPTPSGTPTPSIASLLYSSPAQFEEGVAVSRETILHFNRRLDPASVNPSSVFATFGGETLNFTLHLSPDGYTVTLFYPTYLPASARIRVTVNGDLLRDDLGAAVDANNDGAPGGVAKIDFDTLTLTSVPDTNVCGRVFASELATAGGEPTNVPLAGVRISVSGADSQIFAITDAQGNFRLQNAPAGRFFVHIDGRTVTTGRVDGQNVPTSYPEGPYYPLVGKAWTSVPAAEVNVGDIFLPLILPETLKVASMTDPTEVTFPPDVLQRNPELDGVMITVPPDSLYSDDGDRGGQVGIAPVAPDRLPAPLPDGLNLPLVITVQTDGPTNFDRPVPACFPNLPDPATGQALPPGAASALWSFNHDIGEWEIIGPMTVTADGLFVCTDPGVGIRQPGWHGAAPGTTAETTDPPREQDPSCDSNLAPCLVSIGNSLIDCVLGQIPGLKCAQGVMLAGESIMRNCVTTISVSGGDTSNCLFSIATNVLQTGAGCVGGETIGRIAGAFFCGVGLGMAINDCLGVTCDKSAQAQLRKALMLANLNAIQNDLATLLALEQIIFGDPKWSARPTSAEHAEAYDALAHALLQAMGLIDGTQASLISGPEQTQILGLTLPAGFTAVDVQNVIDRWNNTIDYWTAGIVTASQVPVGQSTNFIQLDDLTAKMNAAFEVLHDPDGLPAERFEAVTDEIQEQVAETFSVPAGQSPNRRLHYVITSPENPFVLRGVTDTAGRIQRLILRPDTSYQMKWLDPVTLGIGSTVFISAGSGFTTHVPPGILTPSSEPDEDGDGLPVDAEFIVGTDPSIGDTDTDGLSDGAEVLQGTNPLDGFPARTGIIASAKTRGQAVDVNAVNNMALVSEGYDGVSVFNVFNGMDPTIIARVNTPGLASSAAISGKLIAVADGAAGLAIIDFTDPPSATVIRQVGVNALGGAAQTVAVGANTAYVGCANGRLCAVDLLTGAVLATAYLIGDIQDVALSGDAVYALTLSRLYALRAFDGLLSVAGSVVMQGQPGAGGSRLRVAAGGALAWVTHTFGYDTIDLTNPLMPTLIKHGQTTQFGWKHLVPNGSGLGIAAVGPASTDDGPHNVSVYDLSDPSVIEDFIVEHETPGIATAVSIFNGLAYVADRAAGLQVINYLPYDTGGAPPTISLSASFSLAPPLAEENKPVRITANVTDDVQVRNVEFYIDNQKVFTDGSFPFEYRFVTPPRSRQTSFILRARASDTGGNFLFSSSYTVALAPDSAAPLVSGVTPPEGAIRNLLTVAAAFFNEPINPATVNGSSLTVTGFGPDNEIGTGDDINVTGAISYRDDVNGAYITFAEPLATGQYRARVGPPISDIKGNVIAGIHEWTFTALSSADDTDGDGLPDIIEAGLGLSPDMLDTDQNGINDGDEDFDYDGSTNLQELTLGTDPTEYDSDGDGIFDGYEDEDGDGLTNPQELILGTNPFNADGDGDGWFDGDEVSIGGALAATNASIYPRFWESSPQVSFNNLTTQTLPNGLSAASDEVSYSNSGTPE